ncbi:unnamed protein product [Ascophyllum nodosum]
MYSFPEDASFTKELDPNHARVLVVGPMLSGKTTLVESLCRACGDDTVASRRNRRPPPTVGCNVEVKLLDGGRPYRSVEFWDVGGNPEAAPARRMFYEDSSISGVLLVYDVTNPRSLRELHSWAAELASAGVRGLFTGGYTSASRGGGSNLPGGSGKRADSGPGSAQSAPRAGRQKYEQRCLRFAGDRESDASGGRTGEDVDLEQGGSQTSGVAVPFLVVGNKRDVGEGVRGKGEAFAAELGAPHVTVSAREWGGESDEPFERFFDAIFRHRVGDRAASQAVPFEGDYDSSWNFPDDSNAPGGRR